MDLSPYLEFATRLAHRAGRITLGYYQTGLRPDFKPDDTPVTAADRAVEQYIRGEIERAYPTHAILGEEFGASIHKSVSVRLSAEGSQKFNGTNFSIAATTSSDCVSIALDLEDKTLELLN